MLGVVPREHDPQVTIAAVGKAPRAHVARDRAAVVRVETASAHRVVVGRVEEHPGDALPLSHRDHLQHSACARALPRSVEDAYVPQASRQEAQPTGELGHRHRVIFAHAFLARPGVVHATAVVADVRELAVHAFLARLRAVHATAVVADVRELAVHAVALRALRDASVRADDPRAGAAAPPAADPTRLAPHPPARHARVVEIGVGHEALCVARSTPRKQGEVPRHQVRLAHRPRSGFRHRVGVACDGPPRVAQEPVEVVDGLRVIGAVRGVRSAQEHGERAREGLHVVIGIAESSPHGGRGVGLSAEPGPRRFVEVFECHCLRPSFLELVNREEEEEAGRPRAERDARGARSTRTRRASRRGASRRASEHGGARERVALSAPPAA